MTLTGIPTNLITGQRGSGKSTLIRHLLSQRPARERWAVLVNDVDAVLPSAEDGVYVSVVADGCICCSGQLGLRVALTRLLRKAQPQRLLIEPSSLARTREVLQLLQDRWLLPVLQIRATITLLAASQHAGGVITDTLDRERIRHADVVAINADAADADPVVEALARSITGMSSQAQIVTLCRGRLDNELLDRPAGAAGRDIRPRFYGDGDCGVSDLGSK